MAQDESVQRGARSYRFERVRDYNMKAPSHHVDHDLAGHKALSRLEASRAPDTHEMSKWLWEAAGLSWNAEVEGAVSLESEGCMFRSYAPATLPKSERRSS